MWLFKSSIGRKFIMAVTGVALVLFVTFHVLMNSVAIFWPAAYNQVCEFLGANWYALIASIGLAALFVIHIVYACWLTLQNRAARGTDRYAVTSRPPQVEWSSKNMLVLGIVIVAFLGLHLVQFWAKMQLQEVLHHDLTALPQLDGVPVGPAQGTLFLQMAFANDWSWAVYLLGFVALWFHMTHGFWSMFHTIGWDNNRWLGRLKCIANIWTSVVIALFVAQVIVFTVLAHKNYYVENEQLQEQYAEYWNQQAEQLVEDFQAPLMAEKAKLDKIPTPTVQQTMEMEQSFNTVLTNVIKNDGPKFVESADHIANAYSKFCSSLPMSEELYKLNAMKKQVEYMLSLPDLGQPQPAQPAAQPVQTVQPGQPQNDPQQQTQQ